MKKKTILFIVIILSVFINLNIVKAANIKIAGGTIEPGQSIDLDVNIEGDDLKDYGKLEFSVQVDPDDNVKIEDFVAYVGTGYTFKKEGNSFVFEIPLNHETITSLSPGKIATVSISTDENLKDDFRVTPTNVKIYKLDGTLSENGPKVVVGTVKYTAPKSTEATLTGLSISAPAINSINISPSFKADTFEYEVIVDDTVSTIKINATPCAKAKVAITGDTKLIMGDNKFKITVTAEDGKTTQIYTVNVVKVKPSAFLEDLYVDNIGLGDISPDFDKNNNKYSITVPKNINALNFKYTLEDEQATVKIDGNKNFVSGENKVTITVTSSDKKQEQIYEITVMKESDEESSEGEKPPVQDENQNDNDEKVDTNNENKKPKYWLIALLGVLVLGVTTGVALILFKKKKRKNKKKKINNMNAPKTVVEKKEPEKKLESLKTQEELSKTTTYNQKDFKDPEKVEDLEKTKEFNFKDFM